MHAFSWSVFLLRFRISLQPYLLFTHDTFRDSRTFSIARQRLYAIGKQHDGHLLAILMQQGAHAICPFPHYIFDQKKKGCQKIYSLQAVRMFADDSLL